MKPNATPLPLYDSELLEFISDNTSVIPVRACGYGVTVQEYATAKKVAYTTAKRYFNTLEKAGKIRKTMMKQNAHLTMVYHK